ncbi:MAG: hypothetical protein ABH954_03565 [Candidatus Omnitrophota bacterium]
MLKRYQVLLNDWLAGHIKKISERYDISFSEVIRLCLCLYIGGIIPKIYPKHKFRITEADISNLARKRALTDKLDTEDFHKLVSKIYFEARKAIEAWEAQEKKKRNKSRLLI